MRTTGRICWWGSSRARLAAAFLAVAAAFAAPVVAQTGAAADAFYRGRQVALIIPAAPGGINDLAGRLAARHFGRFIPGRPTIVVENRDRGGGLALANDFADGAPRNGSVVAILQRGIPQLAIQGDPRARFNPVALTWLGSLSSFATDAYVLVVNAQHPARSIAELSRTASPARIGGDEPGSTNFTFALVARDVLGLNIEVVSGFSGAPAMFRAMKNGDLDGQVIGLNSLMANQRALWEEKAVRVLLQFGRARRHPLLRDVPLGTELTHDREALEVIAFAEAQLRMALPLVAPAGIPADRAAALRRGFSQMVRDRDFLADAKRVGLDITPIDGDAVRRVIMSMAATPRHVIARYNSLMGTSR